MRLTVSYGAGVQCASIDEALVAGVLLPRSTTARDSSAVLTEALRNPLGAPPLESFLATNRDLVVIVNDATRATPTALVLELLHPLLSSLDDARLVVATGTHRAPSDAELSHILGGLEPFWRPRTSIHDSRDLSAMVNLGKTSRGNDVLLNRDVADAGSILVIGSVEPHYFAGYTGGRKSFLPGVAAYETVERNHALAMDPASMPAALEGNPVHEDMQEAADLMSDRDVWSIMAVVDADHNVCGAAAGGLNESFREAVSGARAVFEVPIEERADVVVAVAPPPMDTTLYQAHKALEHGSLALRDGGVIILVSRCREGMGQTSFAELLGAADTPRDAIMSVRSGYELGHHKVARIASIACRAEVWAVTDIDAARIRGVFMRPFPGLQTALDAAIERTGQDARVLVLPDASVTVPVLG